MRERQQRSTPSSADEKRFAVRTGLKEVTYLTAEELEKSISQEEIQRGLGLAERKDFFEQYGSEARAVLDDLLEKYAVYGTAQLTLPDALKVPPVSQRGNVGEIMRLFGGGAALRAAVDQMQALLYAA